MGTRAKSPAIAAAIHTLPLDHAVLDATVNAITEPRELKAIGRLASAAMQSAPADLALPVLVRALDAIRTADLYVPGERRRNPVTTRYERTNAAVADPLIRRVRDVCIAGLPAQAPAALAPSWFAPDGTRVEGVAELLAETGLGARGYRPTHLAAAEDGFVSGVPLVELQRPQNVGGPKLFDTTRTGSGALHTGAPVHDLLGWKRTGALVEDPGGLLPPTAALEANLQALSKLHSITLADAKAFGTALAAFLKPLPRHLTPYQAHVAVGYLTRALVRCASRSGDAPPAQYLRETLTAIEPRCG